MIVYQDSKIVGADIYENKIEGTQPYFLVQNVTYSDQHNIIVISGKQGEKSMEFVCNPDKLSYYTKYHNTMDAMVGDIVKCIVAKDSIDLIAGQGYLHNLKFEVTSIKDTIKGGVPVKIYFGGISNQGVYSDHVEIVKRKGDPYGVRRNNVMDAQIGDTLKCIHPQNPIDEVGGLGFKEGLEFEVIDIIPDQKMGISVNKYLRNNGYTVYSDHVEIVKRKDDPYNVMDINVGDTVECFTPPNPINQNKGAGYAAGLRFVITSVDNAISSKPGIPAKVYYGAKYGYGVYSDHVRLISRSPLEKSPGIGAIDQTGLSKHHEGKNKSTNMTKKDFKKGYWYKFTFDRDNIGYIKCTTVDNQFVYFNEVITGIKKEYKARCSKWDYTHKYIIEEAPVEEIKALMKLDVNKHVNIKFDFDYISDGYNPGEQLYIGSIDLASDKPDSSIVQILYPKPIDFMDWNITYGTAGNEEPVEIRSLNRKRKSPAKLTRSNYSNINNSLKSKTNGKSKFIR